MYTSPYKLYPAISVYPFLSPLFYVPKAFDADQCLYMLDLFWDLCLRVVNYIGYRDPESFIDVGNY